MKHAAAASNKQLYLLPLNEITCDLAPYESFKNVLKSCGLPHCGSHRVLNASDIF